MLTWTEIETRAIAFQNTWKKTNGDERQDAQTFEKDFMNIFGVDFRDGFHEYQLRLNDGSIGYIDYFLPAKIVIEMKSKGKSLPKAYTQAMDYVHALKPEEQPELVMVCDFDKIELHNLKRDIHYKPFKVSQLKSHIRIFGLLAGYEDKFEEKNEIELNTTASYKMAKLHDLLKEYGYEEHALEIYLVRLLFCLFADDTGIFEKDSFEEYIKASAEDGSDLAMRMMMLFNILDTPSERRMKNLSTELNRFRYINGNLFTETLPPAIFDGKMRELLIECCEFDWSKISPAIFGAMFQGVMDQQKRRELGAHYTSEENIMKVIKPLFLEDLYREFEQSKSTKKELEAFHQKISSLKFLDPACGSGNFLILTYQKLRELEFEILKFLKSTAQLSLFDISSKVHINQFYGIEYEPFASEIAKISLLLMKHLMDRKVSNYFGQNLIDFPIKENANIVNGNALRVEWEKVDYILGNPPFIGARMMSKEQSLEMEEVFGKLKGIGDLDYVSAWYFKGANYLKENINTKIAFVSTNSICQGEQVATLWKPILKDLECQINFAYRTFVWNNEAKGKAQVHCIIVGFSNKKNEVKEKKIILKDGEIIKAKNINGYLIDGEDIFIESSKNPINNKNLIIFGNMANDNGNLILSLEEKEEAIKNNPQIEKYIKKFLGATEFINNKERWCLWLELKDLSEIRKNKFLLDKIEKVKKYREQSSRKQTKELANVPYQFGEVRQPKTDYILIPRVSSEKREYVPIGFINKEVIGSDAVLIIPTDDIALFSILTSNVHNAWLRTVGGRLKSDYRYSAKVVYNTFPFIELDNDTREKLEKTGKKILEVREKYPDNSYADLYDPLFMPADLRKAHQENDKAVWEAYGKKWKLGNEEECVAYLMKLYKDLVEK